MVKKHYSPLLIVVKTGDDGLPLSKLDPKMTTFFSGKDEMNLITEG